MTLDAVGVGIGPFNLSLAALLAPHAHFQARFFDRNPSLKWHPGLLLPEATIQVSYLKDLVTLADPTSSYSFLSFLHSTKRLYRFLNTEGLRVTRIEFNQYMSWVASRLSSLEFDAEVREVTLDQTCLCVRVNGKLLKTANLVLGTGLVPNIPECSRPHIGNEVFHSSEFLLRNVDTRNRSVAVIGGGQSGAEVVSHLLADSGGLPSRLLWISRRPNFLPLDESPFTNELFSPTYSDYFFNLRVDQQRALLNEQKLASDGVAEPLLRRIYNRLYELEFLEDRGRPLQLLPGYEMCGLRRRSSGWEIELRDQWNNAASSDVDLIVLCTGSMYAMPAALYPLADRLCVRADGYSLRPDFSIEWDGPPGLRIYVQNAARHIRGIAEPNLSLMAWRGAVIANSLLRSEVYAVTEASSAFDFNSD